MQSKLLRHCMIRVDASEWIGTGHVYRCMNLALELKETYHVTFVCRYITPVLQEFITSAGFELLKLTDKEDATQGNNNQHCKHGTWLHVDYSKEISDVTDLISDYLQTNGLNKIDLMVIDHYAINKPWHLAVKEQVGFICQLDDLADRHHSCDMLIDQNYFKDSESRYNHLVDDDCVRLLGPQYALLKKDFSELRRTILPYSSRIKNGRIVVFFGGIDHTNETGKALKGLLQVIDDRMHLDVILGANNPHKNQLLLEYGNHPQISVSVQVNDMAQRLSDAFLFVGAIGSTTWERCALSLPGVVASVADNQNLLAETLHALKSHWFVGKMSEITSNDYTRAITQLTTGQLEQMSKISGELTDGEGVQRVVRAIEKYAN